MVWKCDFQAFLASFEISFVSFLNHNYDERSTWRSLKPSGKKPHDKFVLPIFLSLTSSNGRCICPWPNFPRSPPRLADEQSENSVAKSTNDDSPDWIMSIYFFNWSKNHNGYFNIATTRYIDLREKVDTTWWLLTPTYCFLFGYGDVWIPPRFWISRSLMLDQEMGTLNLLVWTFRRLFRRFWRSIPLALIRPLVHIVGLTVWPWHLLGPSVGNGFIAAFHSCSVFKCIFWGAKS